MENLLLSNIKLFKYYKNLADTTINRLRFEELQWQGCKNSNSVAIIVKHLSGNINSRWTNFLTEDGEKSWRNRDQEFMDTYTSKEDLMADWESAWAMFFKALSQITPENINQQVFIRGEAHSITDAINRQLAHYAYHIGQIVFLGKLLKGDNWESLSIARGKSSNYNTKKLLSPNKGSHFTNNI